MLSHHGPERTAESKSIVKAVFILTQIKIKGLPGGPVGAKSRGWRDEWNEGRKARKRRVGTVGRESRENYERGKYLVVTV